MGYQCPAPRKLDESLTASMVDPKAELLQGGIFFLIHLFARDVLVMKKLEIKKPKSTFIISVLKVDY